MVDKIKPLKIENSSTGGTEIDPFPRESNPTSDYAAFKGIAFENSDTRLIDLDGSGNLQFLDANQASYFRLNRLVKDFGTSAFSLTASTQATVAGTKVLVQSSNTDQVFTGTTAGQIVQLPNATTLTIGHRFEIWNLSTQQLAVRDAGSNLLATLNSNARTICVLVNNSTSNGVWSLSYTLDNGNIFGTQAYYSEALAETSTTSTTTFLNKVTLVTPTLPLGDYVIFWQFIWRALNANRNLDVRVQRGGVNVIGWTPFTANVADRQLLSGFRRITAISGVQTFTLDFKVSGTATTVYMSQANMLAWRIA
jgi:hypothetical protein